MKLATTGSPGFTWETPGPTSATTPEISWPSTQGTGNLSSPLATWRSEWQTPQAETLIRTSSAFGRGVGISSMASGDPAALRTAAFMGPLSILEGTRPLRGPALDHDFLVGVELDRVPPLGVEIAEETAFPSAEGEHRDRRRDAEVDPQIAYLGLVPELAGGGAAPREEARLVAERRAVDERDRVVHRADVDQPQHGSEDLGLRDRPPGRHVAEDRGTHEGSALAAVDPGVAAVDERRGALREAAPDQ